MINEFKIYIKGWKIIIRHFLNLWEKKNKCSWKKRRDKEIKFERQLMDGRPLNERYMMYMQGKREKKARRR